MPLPTPNSSTNKVRKASSGSRPVVTTLSIAKIAGSNSCTLQVSTGWTDTTAVDVVIYRKDSDNRPVAGTQTDWVATRSGTALSSMVLRAGTEPTGGYLADGLTVVKVAPTAAWVDDLTDAWYEQHLEGGTHGNITATGFVQTSGTHTVPTGVITGANLTTSAITLGYAEITSGFSTSSTTPVQVPGLSVTCTVPAGGRRLKVSFYCRNLSNNVGGRYSVARIVDGAVGSGTNLQELDMFTANAGTGCAANMWVTKVVSPGTKTYNISLNTDSSGGNASSISAEDTSPASILVELI